MVYWIAYLVGFVVVARLLVPHVKDALEVDPSSTFDHMMSAVVAFLVALLWPVILFGALMMWRTAKSSRELKYESKKLKKDIERLENENASMRTQQEGDS